MVASIDLADPSIKVVKRFNFLSAGTSTLYDAILKVDATRLCVGLHYVTD
jgi:hypothetical protein